MRHLIQSLASGETNIIDVPCPRSKSNHLIIKTRCSLISSGTERMLLKFSKGNILQKIKSQPDKVAQVIAKLKSDGILDTLSSVNSKLDEPISLGYCNVGEVVSVGKNVRGIKIGDRVVSNGNHAEFVSVPEMLCAKIPDDVDDEKAVFTILASIGLQGIRILEPTFGETILISGLGIIGLLTCQILKANGINVLAVDTDLYKCEIADLLGIKVLHLNKTSDPLNWCNLETNFFGIDGAIITASTESNEPLNLAAKACRSRGRIILVGQSGSNINRDLFYEKELSFQVSCSYGPGRYDENYESFSNDYPIGFVRWTEQRNFYAVLEAMSKDKIKVQKLVSHKFNFDDSLKAYELLLSTENQLGIILKYNQKTQVEKRTFIFDNKEKIKNKNSYKKCKIGVIGAGNYSSRVLIPNLYSENINIDTIVANEGAKPFYLAKKFKIKKITTNPNELFCSNDINTIIIATRHDSHAEIIVESLIKNKNVFVEKPLCLNSFELDKIINTYKDIISNNKVKPLLMVGFNRRFSPYILKLKEVLLNLKGKKSFIYTINSGKLQNDHWLNNANIGGGRLIGEACHFVDLLLYLAESNISKLSTNFMDGDHLNDVFSINITFKDGSIGTVHYFSNGHKSFPKERLEIFCNEKIFQLDNFRRLKVWGMKLKNKPRTFGQDKGHKTCLKKFVQAVNNGESSPIPIQDIFEVQKFLLNALNL